MGIDRFLQFNDLRELGIVDSRVQLQRMIERADFPPGVRLGVSTRAWPESEIEAWLESRRIDFPPLPGQEAAGGQAPGRLPPLEGRCPAIPAERRSPSADRGQARE